MSSNSHVIIGCGDVGKRIAVQLIESGVVPPKISAYVHSDESAAKCLDLGVDVHQFDLDAVKSDFNNLNHADCYYLVAPQKQGETDLRSRAFLNKLQDQQVTPRKMVLISTTGVYGDCDGEWVTELSQAQPQTGRGKRRLDSEQQWTLWATKNAVPLVVLRVPGIYSYSRLPRQRIAQGIPVVSADECGYTNRIHADDLAAISIVALEYAHSNTELVEIYNATDGVPGKITEYLQAAAAELKLSALPEISMAEAQSMLSEGMLSYLSESRKISNSKMLNQLGIKLRYPNFKEGLKFG